jgi:hypothetical protein
VGKSYGGVFSDESRSSYFGLCCLKVVVEGVLYLPVSPFCVSNIQVDVPRIREAIDRLWSKG